MQHYQWFCIATKGRAQSVPAESVATLTQGQVPKCVPPAAGLLRGTVPREGPQSHRACKSPVFNGTCFSSCHKVVRLSVTLFCYPNNLRRK